MQNCNFSDKLKIKKREETPSLDGDFREDMQWWQGPGARGWAWRQRWDVVAGGAACWLGKAAVGSGGSTWVSVPWCTEKACGGGGGGRGGGGRGGGGREVVRLSEHRLIVRDCSREEAGVREIPQHQERDLHVNVNLNSFGEEVRSPEGQRGTDGLCGM